MEHDLVSGGGKWMMLVDRDGSEVSYNNVTFQNATIERK